MKYRELLDLKGISLTNLHINEVALLREDALLGIRLCQDEHAAILGGDVYFWRADRARVAFANWHVERLPDEDEASYCARSWKKAADYIQAYPPPSDTTDTPIFVIVRKP